MLILFIITGLIIIGLKRTALIPFVIFCQASALSIICYRSGFEIPIAFIVFTIKALIIPLMLYYITRKAVAFEQDVSIIPNFTVISLAFVLYAAASFFSHQLNTGHVTSAAVFTVLIGILFIVSRKTLVSQLTGFIVLQNGIFAFTSSLCLNVTPAMELLLCADVLLSVIILAYAIHMIYEKSGSVAVKTFNSLRG